MRQAGTRRSSCQRRGGRGRGGGSLVRTRSRYAADLVPHRSLARRPRASLHLQGDGGERGQQFRQTFIYDADRRSRRALRGIFRTALRQQVLEVGALALARSIVGLLVAFFVTWLLGILLGGPSRGVPANTGAKCGGTDAFLTPCPSPSPRRYGERLKMAAMERGRLFD